ncbi:glycosyl hydrolase 115 family protein [Cohnella cellulosilytica]|uniref:glycosyl hydrolase 115 family protein n=1 Tax=Cohnella cellulosilytica TaxID=986710 RepID=UPI0036120ABD
MPIIDAKTTYCQPDHLKSAVRHALRMLYRDHETVFQAPATTGSVASEGRTLVRIRYAAGGDACPEWAEAYTIRIADDCSVEIVGRDDLGLVYGILHFSRHVLGVDPFWFWADLPPQARDIIEVPASDYFSKRPRTRFRGWFVNDEVCLIGWKPTYPPTAEVWQPVFEALLRCGGNMVIPGTDLPKSGIHAELASEMGLWMTHHHAEPLGAEMFLRAYEGFKASYHEHPRLFEKLWEEAIEKQKDRNVVWVLSFRGQGDTPFWENDPSFDTPHKRGNLIGLAVRKQYEMIREQVADPVCCMAMYGEIAELYKQGHIQVPEGVILVWADNGYGKMVSRRHGNVNLRVPALPAPKEGEAHGIYYHVTFHDLQASNHLTLFPSPAGLIRDELEAALETGAGDYWLINSGNIRQHLYTLDLIAELWGSGAPGVEEHRKRFVARLFPQSEAQRGAIERLLADYAEPTIRYGPHEDDKAGDEFYHHPARRIVGHWLRGEAAKPDEGLLWAAGEAGFDRQVEHFERLCEQAIPVWTPLGARAAETLGRMKEAEKTRFEDHWLFHIRLHTSGCRGLYSLCRAYRAFREGDAPAAFVYAARSLAAYREGLAELRRAEHGKWESFYSADYLTNVASTVQSVETVVRWIRLHGDSPDFFQWYKQYLMPETEKYIYLENTHRRVLPDEELAARLDALFTFQGATSPAK